MIRQARAGETEVLREVVHDAYRHYIARIGNPPGPMLDDYAARIAAGQAWVLDAEGRIEGVLVLEKQADALLLDNVAVRPTAQGKGHGRDLLRFAEDAARAAGYSAVVLYTHLLMTENQALYSRIGYVETARATEKGFERVYMCKSLGNAVAD